MRCLFAMNIWCQSYIDNFLKLPLPMHMAPENLHGLPDLN